MSTSDPIKQLNTTASFTEIIFAFKSYITLIDSRPLLFRKAAHSKKQQLLRDELNTLISDHITILTRPIDSPSTSCNPQTCHTCLQPISSIDGECDCTSGEQHDGFTAS